MLTPYCVEAGIGEPHGIDHSAVEFGDPGRRRAGARLERYGLRHKAAERIESHDARQFFAVACCTGSENNGILKDDIAENRPEAAVARHREGPPPARRPSY